MQQGRVMLVEADSWKEILSSLKGGVLSTGVSWVAASVRAAPSKGRGQDAAPGAPARTYGLDGGPVPGADFPGGREPDEVGLCGCGGARPPL